MIVKRNLWKDPCLPGGAGAAYPNVRNRPTIPLLKKISSEVAA